MNKRIIKKQAKRFILKRFMSGIFSIEIHAGDKGIDYNIFEKYLKKYFGMKLRFIYDDFQSYNDGTPAILKVLCYPRSQKITSLVSIYTSNNTKCHWNSIFLVVIDSSEKEEYEKKYNPPHT